jgi:hypothetical protein
MTGTTSPMAAGQGDNEPLPPAQLLSQLQQLRSRTSHAARGSWLPLLLFGAIIAGSLAFYRRLYAPPAARFVRLCPVSHPCSHVITVVSSLGYYWQVAIPAGVIITVLWYRWRGNRTGLRTPALPFLIVGLVLAEFVLLIPLLAAQSDSPVQVNLLRDTHQAGPLVIIAVLLWVLAWAERSRALAFVTAGYFVAVLAVSPFTNGGLVGGTTGAVDLNLTGLRLVGLLPALILLVAGAVTWLTGYQAHRRTDA